MVNTVDEIQTSKRIDTAPVLTVNGLSVYYHTSRGPVKAVENVSFDIRAHERLGLVGESGSGKSTIALALLRMIKPPGRIEAGEVILDGTDLLRLSNEQMRAMRLNKISLVAQGAMNSLNPVVKIKPQLIDGMKDHGIGLTDKQMDARIPELLDSVGLRKDVANMYPHELSGGMKQRVCIAIAIALQPEIIIADEPTSALDVVVQRQVMETLERLQKQMGVAIILIGHDMGLMAQFVDRIAVMYAGKFADFSPIRDTFKEPLHPYTQLLISSLPSLEVKGVFKGIPGLPPSLLNLPSGCLFHPRCPHAMDICTKKVPEYGQARPERWVACHLYEVSHERTNGAA
jgi:oligopeptide/dipeptide ABC transporter ATP-binding protein